MPETSDRIVRVAEASRLYGDSHHSLSAHLATGANVDDGAIREVLGNGVVAAFRHAQTALHGAVRKTTGEPSFCHSADIALRARMLAYDPERTLVACLLHDVVEDRSKTLAEVSQNLNDLTTRFGAPVAHDVQMLTNRYSTIINEVARGAKIDKEPFGEDFMWRFGEALAHFRRNLSGCLAAEFYAELDLLRDFLPAVDVNGGLARARSDRSYKGASELRLQAYRLFVQELCDDAAHRFRTHASGQAAAEAPLICKLLDLIDNLRTSPVVIRRSLERTLLKCELFLDCSFYLHGVIYQRQLTTTFVTAYDLLKYNLIQQLRQRRIALGSLSDTRFAPLADHLMREGTRLEAKYRVDREVEPHMEVLSARIRALNQH